MKYRIPYTACWKGGSSMEVETIEASSDEEAIQKFHEFKSEKEKNNGKFSDSYLVSETLIRVDQEEITTRIF